MTIQKLESMLRLTTMRGHEARRGLTLAATTICAALGCMPVRVKFCGGTVTASMTGTGDMRLADIDDDAVVGRAQFCRWTGFVVHELLHRKFTGFAHFDSRPYVHTLHNGIEDAWIERKAIREGLLGNISGLLKTLADGMAADAMQSVQDWADPAQYPFSLAIFARGFAQRVPVCADLLPIWEEAERRIDACADTKDTLMLAQWVFNQLQLPQDQREQPQDQPKQGDEAGDESGDAGQPGDGEADGEADGDDAGKGAGKPDDAGKSRKADGNSHPQQVEPSMQGATTNDANGGTYSEGASLLKRLPLSHDIAHRTQVTVPGRLRFEVRKLFEDTAQDEFQRGRRNGSVDVGKLSSVATGNLRPFKRRLEAEGIESAVVLLLDISQSMWGGHLIGTAVASTIALGEVLTAAGVDVAVLAFGSQTAVLAGFGEPFKRTSDKLRRVVDQASTNDYFGVRYSHDMLLRHSAERKVCFVLTDGEGHKSATSHQCRVGKNLGITTIGIGIRANVHAVFGRENSIRVDDMSSLATVALSKIKLAA
jgi:hypothetical protein